MNSLIKKKKEKKKCRLEFEFVKICNVSHIVNELCKNVSKVIISKIVSNITL